MVVPLDGFTPKPYLEVVVVMLLLLLLLLRTAALIAPLPRGLRVIGNRSKEGLLAAATFLSTYYQKHFLLLQCNP
ncbi:hypothetical protein PUN28_017073 [Cardiocondyla obscurior]|uniref:ATP synthase F0 subunit 8 n=1 Tax=Cardiocondyla obscurior TaxID=286306 RepID=A0AAW2EQ03_9HYME